MTHEPRHRDHAHSAAGEEPMEAARPPVGTGTTPVYALLLALGLVALGVVAIRDALAEAGAVPGTSWTASAVDSLDGTQAEPWMPVLFVVAIAASLILLLVVLKPRPRRAITLTSSTGVFLRTGDLARISRASTRDVDGVSEVRATATRRRLSLVATSIASRDHNAAMRETIDERLSEVLTALNSPPRTKIRIQNEGHRR